MSRFASEKTSISASTADAPGDPAPASASAVFLSAPPVGAKAFSVLRRAVAEHNIRRVVCGVSGGKDSVACLDVCMRIVPEVRAYFMYLVPGLSFQQDYIHYLERIYSPLKIMQLPHWLLSGLFRDSTFRHPTARSTRCPSLTIRDIEAYITKMTGIEWFATGEKAIDSLERNAQIRNCEGVNEKRRRVFPLAYWNHASVYTYLKSRGIALPPDYNLTAIGRSFGSLWGNEIAPIREKFPDNYAKIVRQFPFVEAQVKRYEYRNEEGKGRKGEGQQHGKKRGEQRGGRATSEKGDAPTETAS